MKHHEITGKDAVHPFAFVQSSDPVADPENEVAPGKAWFDLDTNRLKIRNDTDDGWIFVGAAVEEIS